MTRIVDPSPFRDDGYAQLLRNTLARYKRLGVPFDRAWLFTLAKHRPPREWGADRAPRGREEQSVIYWSRPYFEAAYNDWPARLPREWVT